MCVCSLFFKTNPQVRIFKYSLLVIKSPMESLDDNLKLCGQRKDFQNWGAHRWKYLSTTVPGKHIPRKDFILKGVPVILIYR